MPLIMKPLKFSFRLFPFHLCSCFLLFFFSLPAYSVQYYYTIGALGSTSADSVCAMERQRHQPFNSEPLYSYVVSFSTCYIRRISDDSIVSTAPLTSIIGCPSGKQDDGSGNCVDPPPVCIAPQILNSTNDACIDPPPVIASTSSGCLPGYSLGLALVSGCVGSTGEPQPPSECIAGTANCFYSSDGSQACANYQGNCYETVDGWVVLSNNVPTFTDRPTSNFLDLGLNQPIDTAPIDTAPTTGGTFNQTTPTPNTTVDTFQSSLPTNAGFSGVNTDSNFTPPSVISAPVIGQLADGSITDLANVNRSIYNLLQDQRAQELMTMLGYLNSIDRTEAEILQYQAKHFDKFVEIRNELGLSRLDDQQFYDLMTKKTDFSNDRLVDIFRLIDWSANESLIKQQKNIDSLSRIAQQNDSLENLQQQIESNTSGITSSVNNVLIPLNQIESNTAQSNTNEQSLITAVTDSNTKLDDIVTQLQQAQSQTTQTQPCDPLVDNNCLPANIGDSGLASVVSMLNNMETSSPNSAAKNLAFMNDMTESNLITMAIDSFSQFFPDLPSPSCSGSISTTIFGRSIDISPCAKLAPLRDALAWVFGLLVFRVSFNNLFQAKG